MTYSEEKIMVFEMLSDGKINTQDAIGLLQALQVCHQSNQEIIDINIVLTDELDETPMVLEGEYVH